MSSVDRLVKHTLVGGMPVALTSLERLITLALEDAPRTRLAGARARLVFDVNGQGMSLYASNKDYRHSVDQADIIHADGQFVVTASRIFSEAPVENRSSTTDLFLDLLPELEKRRVSIFLLGGDERVNKTCFEVLIHRYPNLKIAGRHSGFFKGNEAAVIEKINSSGTDILWVGLGKPLEQEFSTKHRESLQVGWIVTCGGLFNYITGDYPRAPRLMQDAGLEWLHRVATNPKRFFWRYVTTNPHALWLVWKNRRRAVQRR